MLERQNVKASYHPMSIHFLLTAPQFAWGGGAVFLTPLRLVMPMQYCPWDTTQAMRSHQRSLGGRPGERLGSICCPSNLTFPLHSCLKGKAILWLEDKAHCAKDSGGGQMLITLWILPALAHFQASCWMRETEPPILFQPLFSQLAFPCNGM